MKRWEIPVGFDDVTMKRWEIPVGLWRRDDDDGDGGSCDEGRSQASISTRQELQ
ncbi:hypothetical protein HanXRQr2_Chr06g0265571 [Helianthus annuus]|uniref:Uncharacterized protein n=1 Tax=Helianthus annuus TaxID=4232 RepID=A0A9K3IUC1_HELAN|nr:hypothetical protein HanXRQr2_Chr06g0265571 [Helianthus annuus]